jgi:predicted dithiol-disulfide oxidoreductase (DUF899 family)
MGWTFDWASWFGGDFNLDFNVQFTEAQQREGGIKYNHRRESQWTVRALDAEGPSRASARREQSQGPRPLPDRTAVADLRSLAVGRSSRQSEARGLLTERHLS